MRQCPRQTSIRDWRLNVCCWPKQQAVRQTGLCCSKWRQHGRISPNTNSKHSSNPSRLRTPSSPLALLALVVAADFFATQAGILERCRVALAAPNSALYGPQFTNPRIPMPQSTPVVVCPGCKREMNPSEPAPAANGLSEITYTCPKCGTSTRRVIKPAD